MEVHQGLDQLPLFNNAVLTIGAFDGVHVGHQAIISQLIQKAKAVNGESIILTFHPHPRQVVFPNDTSLKLLNTLEEKIELLASTGLDHLIIAPFTVEFSQINPYKYVDDVLINQIQVKHLIIGYDHRFGQNREGNIDLLNIYARQESFTVEEIPKQDIKDLHVSSTTIRNSLLKGDIIKANILLGGNFCLQGKVTRGDQIAGGLGYPTANCKIEEKAKIIPATGTYAARAICDNMCYEGMLYIGKSPTLQQREEPVIEMNLFADVAQSLYGKTISIYPLKQFRGDQKFNSKSELEYNIARDRVEIEHYFLSLKKSLLLTTAILNYNGEQFLREYLPSHKEDNKTTISVIDNASSDESLKVLSECDSKLHIIQLNENKGYAGGYNSGLQNIGSKYVAFVNSDVRVTKDWHVPIIELMEQDEKIAAVQPKILSVTDPELFEYAGASGGFMDLLGYPLCRGRILNSVEPDNGQYDDTQEIFWASGAAFVMRTDLFKLAGGFDEDFFAHMEEIDLCWRLKNAGYKIICTPDSTVYHLGGGTLSYNSPRKVFLNLRNNYWMILKNKSIASLLFVVPVRIFIDVAYVFLFLLKADFSKFYAGIKGIVSGLSGMFTIGKKRKRQQYLINRIQIKSSKTIVQNKTGMLQIWLPFSYFLFGKKKFDEL